MILISRICGASARKSQSIPTYFVISSIQYNINTTGVVVYIRYLETVRISDVLGAEPCSCQPGLCPAPARSPPPHQAPVQRDSMAGTAVFVELRLPTDSLAAGSHRAARGPKASASPFVSVQFIKITTAF